MVKEYFRLTNYLPGSEVRERKLAQEMKVFLFTPLRKWSREAFQRETLEETGKYSACHSNVVNYSQIREGPSFWRNGWGRLIITRGDIHLLEIRDLQAAVAVLLLEVTFSQGDRRSSSPVG